MNKHSFSPAEVREILCIGNSTIRKYIKKGLLVCWRLPPDKNGQPGERRITRDSIMKLCPEALIAYERKKKAKALDKLRKS